MKAQGPNGGVASTQNPSMLTGQQPPGLGKKQAARVCIPLLWVAGSFLGGIPAGAAGPVSHTQAPGVSAHSLFLRHLSHGLRDLALHIEMPVNSGSHPQERPTRM